MISAINPFGYPFSETEPDVRLIRGVARSTTNLESRRPWGNYKYPHVVSTWMTRMDHKSENGNLLDS
jgi:hypothetical protein